MPIAHKDAKHSRCSCGKVQMEAYGLPIVSCVCYCDDCQAGGRQIEALPHAPRVLDPDGGTALVLYRKDRIAWTKGAELLRHDKIAAKSATNRIVATCCNTGMVMSFDDSRHWVSTFRNRFQDDVLPAEMRVRTKFKSDAVTLPGDLPNYPGGPPILMWKLVKAWIPMLVGR
jgi:hypothetical protein